MSAFDAMSAFDPSATFGNVRVQSEMRGITDISYRAEFNANQLASRQAVAGINPLSAPSCNRTGSRSPSVASRKTQRTNSSGFTVVLPIDLSVSHASSKAVSKSTSVGGSKELLWNPRMAPSSIASYGYGRTR
jgi:hypothetical protein